MSRQYDNSFVDVPTHLFDEDYAYSSGIRYSRIQGFPDYFVTDDGCVISMKREDPIILDTWKNKHGHHYVQLSDRHGYRQKRLVHRLVAQAFIPNPRSHPIVRHLDDDPDNNNYDNLAWGTAKDNREDCVRNGNDFRKEVYCFETDCVYRSGADAARSLGVHKSQVTTCCEGKSGNARGYHFCYADEIDEKRSDKNWLRDRALKPVIAYGPNGEVKRYSSRKEAGEDIGIPDSGISNVLAGRISHTHGWRFEEGD